MRSWDKKKRHQSHTDTYTRKVQGQRRIRGKKAWRAEPGEDRRKGENYKGLSEAWKRCKPQLAADREETEAAQVPESTQEG